MRIIVIGEICNDVFIYGETKRLSPEAPVPVFIPTRETHNWGMAGNVVRNLSAINHDADVDLITHSKNTITKTRYVDDKSNHMFIRVDNGDDKVEPLTLTTSDIIRIKQSDIIIVSDYNKKFLNESTLIQIGKSAKFSVLDEKGKFSENILNYFNFIKVNEHEYNVNKEILSKYLDKVIITMGIKGAKYKDKIFESVSPKETIDVSGAGDTFISAFALKYFETKDVSQSIIYANIMSSIVVSKRGVATP